MSKVSNKAISDYLSEKGICHSNRGYKYLMLGVRNILDGKVDRSRIQTVYESVAGMCGISSGQVENAIRLAVRKSTDPVSNKEFLLQASDELALTADANAFIFQSVKPESQ